MDEEYSDLNAYRLGELTLITASTCVDALDLNLPVLLGPVPAHFGIAGPWRDWTYAGYMTRAEYDRFLLLYTFMNEG